MTDPLLGFINSPEPIIANAAKRLEALGVQLSTKLISLDEYYELAGDAIDLAKVTDIVNHLDRRIKIQEAFDAMVLVVEAAMSFKP